MKNRCDTCAMADCGDPQCCKDCVGGYRDNYLPRKSIEKTADPLFPAIHAAEEVSTIADFDLKTDWIEINLPWRQAINFDDSDLPEYPDEIVDKLVTEKFNVTKTGLHDEFEEKHGTSLSLAYYDAIYDLKENNPNEEDERKILKLLFNSKDATIKEILHYKNLLEQIDNFTDTIPEVIRWKGDCSEHRKKRDELKKKNSFSYSALCRPGVLIEVENNKTISKYLIGDINSSGGKCDDCMAFNEDAMVLRAKILIENYMEE